MMRNLSPSTPSAGLRSAASVVIALFAVITLGPILTPHAHAGEPIAVYGDAWLEEVGGLPVLHMKGTEREMGEQYGYLAGHLVEANVHNLRDIAMNATSITKWVPKVVFEGLRRAVGWIFWQTYSRDVKDHIEGIVEGARKRSDRIKLHKMDVSFINTVIDIVGIVRGLIDKENSTPVSAVLQPFTSSDILKFLGVPDIHTNCDSMAVWGPRTQGGKTFQTRNTDIQTGDGIERYPLVLVYKKDGHVPVVSTAFAGMVGVFSGMNAHGVALGQVWAFSKDVKLHNPWHLQIREVFMQARNAREAVLLFSRMKNVTYGSNFVIADAGDGADGHFSQGFAIEASSKRFVVFEPNDPRELVATYEGEPYGLPLPYAVLRGDVTMDPEMRARATGANGPYGDPREAGSYRQRYLGQYERIVAYEQAGVLMGKEEAEAISRETAMRGASLQTTVYANTDRDIWVSYAEIRPDGSVRQAYEGEYIHIPFRSYLDTVGYDAAHRTVTVHSYVPGQSRELELRVTQPARGRQPAREQLLRVTSSDRLLRVAEIGELHAGDSLELRDAATGQLVDRRVVR